MKKKSKYGILSNMIYVYSESWEFMRCIIYFTIIDMICSIIMPMGNIILPKIAVDLVLSKADMGKALQIIGVFGVIMVVVYAIKGYTSDGKYFSINAFRGHITKKIIMKSLTCDYKFMERAKGQNMYEKAIMALARGDVSGSSEMFMNSQKFIVNFVCFVLYSGVISTLNPLILILVIGMSAVNWFALRYARNYEISKRDKAADIDHKLYYLQKKIKDNVFAKDIRIYSMKDFIMKVEKNLVRRDYELKSQVERRNYTAQIINGITLILRDGISYIYLIIAVSRGDISVGNFVMYFGAITGLSSFVSDMVSNIGLLIDASSQINDVRAYLDYDEQHGSCMEAIPKLNAESGEAVIEFKNVTFSYDDNEKVLNNFNMKINYGEKVALVGINGAGKTSIVKLMCGFYKADSGEILINGVNVNNINRDELMEMYSVVFQDIMLLPLTIAENVSMNTLEKTDMGLVERCLKTADLYKEIMKHRNGIYTYIGNYVGEKGINLSGGQLQKLLIARALYKNGAVMILDEPTAALDPIAEDEVYNKFRDIIGDKTAVYISHRLSSTRFCDKIVFLNNGNVCEQGTHEELMKRQGEYSKLFELQSHYYKSKAQGEKAI